MSRLAEQLDLSMEETAAGILEINNMRAASLVRQQTLERGHDPRDYVLYAYGGAGPMHAFGYAAESGVREVVIPLGNGASTLSAYGIASGDVVVYRELERGLLAPFEGERAEALAAAVAEVEDAARVDLRSAGSDSGDVVVQVDALMRYREQLMHRLEIPVALPASPDVGAHLLTGFESEYVRRYGSGATAMFESVEVFAFRARASVAAGVPIPEPVGRRPAPPETTHVYWPGSGWTATEVHRGAPGVSVCGPALIELSDTTIAVPPGASLAPGSRNELRLQLPTSEESPR
jgi:N-methylhydantoinase A